MNSRSVTVNSDPTAAGGAVIFHQSIYSKRSYSTDPQASASTCLVIMDPYLLPDHSLTTGFCTNTHAATIVGSIRIEFSFLNRQLFGAVKACTSIVAVDAIWSCTVMMDLAVLYQQLSCA